MNKKASTQNLYNRQEYACKTSRLINEYPIVKSKVKTLSTSFWRILKIFYFKQEFSIVAKYIYIGDKMSISSSQTDHVYRYESLTADSLFKDIRSIHWTLANDGE